MENDIKSEETVKESIITPVEEKKPRSTKKSPLIKKPLILAIAGGALLVIILMGYLFSLGVNKSKKTKVVESNTKASQALVKGDLAQTVKSLQDSHSLSPKDISIDVALLKAIATKGNLEGKEGEAFTNGKKYADEALKDSPEDAEVLLAAGYLYEIGGHYLEAYDLYVKATQLYPKNAQAWFRKGHVMEFSQNPQDPTKEYELAYSLDQEDPLILMAMGMLYYRKAKPDEAISLYLKAATSKVATNAIRAEALANASTIRRDQIIYMADAIALSKQAVEIDPTFSPALAAHGFNLGINGQFNEGVSYVQRSIDTNPRIALNYWYMGVLMRSVKSYKESLRFYNSAYLAVDNDNTILGAARKTATKASYEYEVALANDLAGNKDGVLQSLTNALQNNPTLKERLNSDYKKFGKFKSFASNQQFLKLL